MHKLLMIPDTLLGWLDDRLERRSGAGSWPLAALLLAPALFLIGVFSFYPMLYSVWMSLHAGKRGDGPFMGLENYREALGSADFWHGFGVTFYYVAGTVPLTLVLGFAIALCLHRIIRLRGFFRTLFFLPYVTSVVAAATVWRALLNPRNGVANLLLEWAGLPAQNWLLEPRGVLHIITSGMVPPDAGPSLALCCVMAFDVWHGCGFAVVVFLAGLSAVPRELEDAARIDGAGAFRTVWSVTLPLLSPTIFFLGVVGVIKGFQAFNSFYALTQGGASGNSRNMVLYIYSQFYDYGYWGYGTAVSTLLTLAIVALTAVQWRVAGRRVHYA